MINILFYAFCLLFMILGIVDFIRIIIFSIFSINNNKNDEKNLNSDNIEFNLRKFSTEMLWKKQKDRKKFIKPLYKNDEEIEEIINKSSKKYGFIDVYDSDNLKK